MESKHKNLFYKGKSTCGKQVSNESIYLISSFTLIVRNVKNRMYKLGI